MICIERNICLIKSYWRRTICKTVITFVKKLVAKNFFVRILFVTIYNVVLKKIDVYVCFMQKMFKAFI